MLQNAIFYNAQGDIEKSITVHMGKMREAYKNVLLITFMGGLIFGDHLLNTVRQVHIGLQQWFSC